MFLLLSFVCVYVCVCGLRLELKVSCLLGGCYTTWATPQHFFYFDYVLHGVSSFSLGWHRPQSSYLCLRIAEITALWSLLHLRHLFSMICCQERESILTCLRWNEAILHSSRTTKMIWKCDTNILLERREKWNSSNSLTTVPKRREKKYR
jgi:hypothetical protein